RVGAPTPELRVVPFNAVVRKDLKRSLHEELLHREFDAPLFHLRLFELCESNAVFVEQEAGGAVDPCETCRPRQAVAEAGSKSRKARVLHLAMLPRTSEASIARGGR